MSPVVLEVKNVSKRFTMRKDRRDTIKGTVARLFEPRKRQASDFCALKDISFQLSSGEALGVIGKNGAGKSTLLRILSGISQPDEGEINFYGRAVSILDIGAGFHPDLSGRENVYLAASLYKFTREKIQARFREIVEFSGIEEFIDEPVKNYSSGMYLRLAFSLITCLDADIYIIDEVINVGDANFQMKCKAKIEDLVAAGKTLLIASHNLNEIAVLCNRIILLEDGVIVDSGGNDVIQKYMTRALPQFFSFAGNNFYHQRDLQEQFAAITEIKLLRFGLEDYKILKDGINAGLAFKVFFELELILSIPVVIRLKVYDGTGALVFVCSSFRNIDQFNAAGRYRLEFEMPAHVFNARMYSIDMNLFGGVTQAQLLTADKILTIKMDCETVKNDAYPPEMSPGLVRPLVATRVLKIQ